MVPLDDVFRELREKFARLATEHRIADEPIVITARPLSPGEAIGNPEAKDYPLLKGKERMMEASFLGSKGHAFTDMCGEWSGALSDVIHMDLPNNFRRAVFIASLNAVARHVGLVEHTVHCRDDGPSRCGEECARMLAKENPSARILLVGHQPRLLEQLSRLFSLKVVDMDQDNIGKKPFGVTISGPEATNSLLKQTDIALVTGTTIVNGTIGQFLSEDVRTIFFGVTIAGAASLLDLRRFCPFGL